MNNTELVVHFTSAGSYEVILTGEPWRMQEALTMTSDGPVRFLIERILKQAIIEAKIHETNS